MTTPSPAPFRNPAMIDPTAPGHVPQRSNADILRLRRQVLNPTLSVSYNEPLKIVRGEGIHLYDQYGQPYLDMVNNVCHVGHCHLHDNIVEYALRLTATLPAALSVVFLTNSGTEANDLALRLARAHTRARGVIVVDHAYHGHSPSMVELSPYKFNGKGGQGQASHVGVVAMPDVYRGPFREPSEAGRQYGALLQPAIESLRRHDIATAAFYCESLLGCGGQIVLPEGYLAEAYAAVRAAGGVCLADEVQVGFGRVGEHFW